MAVDSTSQLSLPIFLVDAFASKQFEGNPAAVCLLNNEVLNDHQMLKIAQEMNQSETAFVSPVNPADNFQTGADFNLRWFTPTNEVNLCGHATMATSAVIFERKNNTNEKLTFHTRSGELNVVKSDGQLVMDFPLNETVKEDPEAVRELIQIVIADLPTKEVEFSEKTAKLLVRLPDSCSSIGKMSHQDIQFAPVAFGDLVIRLPDSTSRTELESLKPDTTAMMKAYPTGRVRGVIITLRGSSENGAFDERGEPFDFMSRYFAPWNGIPEDPVTGAAHTVLASYWSRQLNKTDLYARQCSARGGNVQLTVKETRVNLAGKAAIVLEGMITLQV